MLKNLVRIGFARGIGGSRAWLTIGVVAGGLAITAESCAVNQAAAFIGSTVSIQPR